jgi:hypothetical protein
MLVHFRETPYGLAMSLVETRREKGKVRHEHVASLGSIETPPSVAARIEFWRGLHKQNGGFAAHFFSALSSSTLLLGVKQPVPARRPGVLSSCSRYSMP